MKRIFSFPRFCSTLRIHRYHVRPHTHRHFSTISTTVAHDATSINTSNTILTSSNSTSTEASTETSTETSASTSTSTSTSTAISKSDKHPPTPSIPIPGPIAPFTILSSPITGREYVLPVMQSSPDDEFEIDGGEKGKKKVRHNMFLTFSTLIITCITSIIGYSLYQARRAYQRVGISATEFQELGMDLARGSVWVSQSLIPPSPTDELEPLSHHLLDKHTLLQLSVQEAEFVLRTLITLFGTVCDDNGSIPVQLFLSKWPVFVHTFLAYQQYQLSKRSADPDTSDAIRKRQEELLPLLLNEQRLKLLFDPDQSGTIDFKEVFYGFGMLLRVGLLSDADTLTRFEFSLLDEDGDGRANIHELIRWVKFSIRVGFINPVRTSLTSHRPIVLTAEQIATELMSQFDHDNDYHISLAEFQQLYPYLVDLKLLRDQHQHYIENQRQSTPTTTLVLSTSPSTSSTSTSPSTSSLDFFGPLNPSAIESDQQLHQLQTLATELELLEWQSLATQLAHVDKMNRKIDRERRRRWRRGTHWWSL